ncbi:tRNA pseudouridine(13) synthase TruD [Candidatus Woesearchaeota archaeon]|nr:tRNA pseudouridine(13) synthase TruD [Candidatus Woesearchaeota archaeon]
MYQIKQSPEEFIVVEKNDIIPKESGRYNVCRLTKKDMNTMDAIRDIAKRLHIPEKRIGFAGTKDKIAKTEQYITIDAKHNTSIISDKYNVESLGYLDEPLTLGMLQGNSFKILIRNLEQAPVFIDEVPNLFGEQRFSENNAVIGKMLIKGRYEEAVQELEAQNANLGSKENPMQRIQSMSRRDLRLFIHSYQSLIWNTSVHRMLQKGIRKEEIPLVGFGTRLHDYPIVKEILNEQQITERDFINRQIPFLSSEGDMRRMFLTIKDLSIGQLQEDDINQGKKKCEISFTLSKGSYATVVISYVCGEQAQLARHCEIPF